MERQEKFTAVHFVLLGLTAAFLAALLVASRMERADVPGDGYTVSVERGAAAEEEIVPEHAPIDINTATAEELEELIGIGPVLAEAIVNYRAEHGPFASVDELLEVSGIGAGKLEGIRNDVTAGEGKDG